MTKTYAFQPHHRTDLVALVGLGGTGSQWARTLARTIFHLRKVRQHVPSLVFIDPDKVEEHNVGRQMFTEADIGEYKAELLAKRFSYALGLDIAYYNEPFDAVRHCPRWGTIVCGAVDNHVARRELAKVQGIWIDAGNHYAAGQVVIGNTDNPDLVHRDFQRSNVIAHLPHAGCLYPSLLQPEPSPLPAASCAEAVLQGEQHPLINDVMGVIAGGYTYKLLMGQLICSFVTFVYTQFTLSVKSIPISPDTIRSYLS